MIVARLLIGALLTTVAAASVVSPASGARQQQIRLEFHDDPADSLFGAVTVKGLEPALLERLARLELDRHDWVQVVSLRLAEAPAGAPPILASPSVTGRTLLLQPRFLPRGGLDLIATFDGLRLGELLDLEGAPLPVLEQRVRMPLSELAPSTVVQGLFPSSPEVPENLLRLYLHFSAPMRAAAVLRHVHLYDGTGREVELPFVEVEPGLWDPGQSRLTLFFHPGRIKRGVGPNLALGPPLRAGESYTLVVDREMRDARGLPLASDFRTTLAVGPPDRVSPDPLAWRLVPPGHAGEPLVVDLDEPLDRALLHRLISVRRSAGERIEGRISVARGERRWSFLPHHGWQPGDYLLEVSRLLEDRAGNTPASLFDTPTGSDEAGEIAGARTADPLRLPFRVALPPAGD